MLVEDSGDENQLDINNLPPSMIQNQVEVNIRVNEEDWSSEDELPLSTLQNTKNCIEYRYEERSGSFPLFLTVLIWQRQMLGIFTNIEKVKWTNLPSRSVATTILTPKEKYFAFRRGKNQQNNELNDRRPFGSTTGETN
ncbi:hypothetical protein WA026_014934 [Henosepilachna vigintioctopunctata]|uniref:Uncharacterized protein n=1 Tax=Henosepilachna vigintioctopunctata TaxID=420089 RepID=A0AAW1UZ45_9CUCU